MRFHPVVVIDPLLALALVFWKPLLVAFAVLVILAALMFPVALGVSREAARASVAPTLYIPETWRTSLTQAALTPVPKVP